MMLDEERRAMAGRAHELASALSAADGGRVWAANDHNGERQPSLVSEGEGLRLSLRLSNYGASRGKLAVSHDAGSLWAYTRSGEGLLEIAMSPEKPVEAQARDIARRLLPAARERLAELQAKAQAQHERAERARALRDRLLQAGGGRLKAHEQAPARAGHEEAPSSYTMEVRGVLAGGAWGELVSYEDDATLKLRSVSPELAEALLRVLAEHS